MTPADRCPECDRPFALGNTARDVTCNYTGSEVCDMFALRRWKARALAAEAVLREPSTATIDVVAQAIYSAAADEVLAATGACRVWSTGAPWDTNPGELCEWERDDYREMAERAVNALRATLAAQPDEGEKGGTDG